MALAPGLVKTPFVDDSGLISNPWAKFLEEVATGTHANDGDSSAAQITALQLAVASLGSQIAALTRRVRVLELGVQM